MGGSSPSGHTTTTTNNTPFNSAQVLDYQNRAVDLANNNPYQYYPGQTMAPVSGNQTAAATNLTNLGLASGDAIGSAVPEAQHMALTRNAVLANGAGVTGGMPTIDNLFGLSRNNPTAGGINALNPVANGTYLQGTAPYTSGLQSLTSGTAANSLARSANGDYLNSNPNLDRMFDSAANAVTRAYQTSTSPQVDASMEAAGRFNSGGLGNARSVNQRNLGDTLDQLSSSIYGNNYNTERGLQNSAAANLGNLQTNALVGAGSLFGNAVNTLTNAATNSGQLGALGQNSQSTAGNAGLANYANLLAGQQAAIHETPAQTGMATTDYNTGLTGGNTLQSQQQQAITDAMSRFYGVQQAPWTTAQTEAGIIGSAIPGMSSSSTPYFTNPLGQALGAAGSVASALPLITGGK